MKICFTCKIEKDISLFPRNKRMKAGYEKKCKECTYKSVREHRLKNNYFQKVSKDPERIAKRKEWLKTQSAKESFKNGMKRYYDKNPLKKNAHIKFRSFYQRNKHLRMPCVVCGNIKSEGHHTDYTKPLEVTWLCRKHHMEEHSKIKAMNRNKDNNEKI